MSSNILSVSSIFQDQRFFIFNEILSKKQLGFYKQFTEFNSEKPTWFLWGTFFYVNIKTKLNPILDECGHDD